MARALGRRSSTPASSARFMPGLSASFKLVPPRQLRRYPAAERQPVGLNEYVPFQIRQSVRFAVAGGVTPSGWRPAGSRARRAAFRGAAHAHGLQPHRRKPATAHPGPRRHQHVRRRRLLRPVQRVRDLVQMPGCPTGRTSSAAGRWSGTCSPVADTRGRFPTSCSSATRRAHGGADSYGGYDVPWLNEFKLSGTLPLPGGFTFSGSLQSYNPRELHVGGGGGPRARAA